MESGQINMKIKNILGHLKTITTHKKTVRKGCFRVGLYKQGMLHDLSKFSPTEFLVGMKYYQGDRSPNNAEREQKGYSSAWLHHKGRNKHHYEYWIDYSTKAIEGGMAPAPMPKKYVIEMFMDRVAASKTYEKEKYTDSHPLMYFMSGKGEPLMHPETRKLLLKLLTMLSKKGEAYTFAYIRRVILQKKKRKPPYLW